MNEEERPPRTKQKIRLWIRIVVPVLIILIGFLVRHLFIVTRPEVKKVRPKPTQVLVEVREVARTTTNVAISAMGTVIPSRAITLRSRVQGEVVAVDDSFVDGAFIGAGQELLRIDAVDYELAVAQAEARLVQADFELQVEQGRQKVAAREWELLGPEDGVSDQERALALRMPHLKSAEAMKASAEAALKDAQLDLERTRVRAPFNAVVQNRHVNLGEQVGAQGALVDLAGTDRFWIETAVPQDRLAWMDIPRHEGDPASSVTVDVRGGDEDSAPIPGRMLRLLSGVAEQGRLARALIEVNDPFGLKEGGRPRPLLLGSYVRIRIEGREVKDVVAIPRSALHDGDRVWVAGPGDQLEIRAVHALWRGADNVLIDRGLEEGDLLITSGLSAPIEGMALTVVHQESGQGEPVEDSGDGN